MEGLQNNSVALFNQSRRLCNSLQIFLCAKEVNPGWWMLWSTFFSICDMGPDVSPDAPDPQVLTWCQFCLCIAKQQSFIESSIRVSSAANKPLVIVFKLAPPANPVTQTGTLQDLLLRKDIIQHISE